MLALQSPGSGGNGEAGHRVLSAAAMVRRQDTEHVGVRLPPWTITPVKARTFSLKLVVSHHVQQVCMHIILLYITDFVQFDKIKKIEESYIYRDDVVVVTQ